MSGMAEPLTLTQDLFRFRTVNATSAGASDAFEAGDPALNTDHTIDADTVFRLRIRIQANASNDGTQQKRFQLRYSLNGAAYAAVTSSTPIQAAGAAVTGYTEDTITSAQFVPGFSPGSGTALSGYATKNDAICPTVGTQNWADGERYSAHEFGLRIDPAQVSEDDFFDLRIYEDNGTPLDNYASGATPRITTGAVPPPEPHDWDTVSFNSLEGGRHLVRASNGDLYAVAQVFKVGTDDVSVFRSTNNGSDWDELDPGNRPDDADSGFSDTCVAIDSNDNLHIAWPLGATNYKYAVFNTTTESWGTPETVTIGTTAAEANRGAIAVDSNNVPHLVVRGFDDSTGNHYIRYTNRVGGSWNSGVHVDTAGGGVYRAPAITIDGSDLPIIAYARDNNLRAAIGNANNATSFTPQTVGSVSTATNSEVDVATDSSDDVWVVYRANTSNEITVVQHINTDSWSTWQTPVSSGEVGKQPTVAVDDASNVVVIYISGTAATGDVVANVFSGTWSGETTLNTGSFRLPKARWQSLNNPTYTGDRVEYLYHTTTAPRLRYDEFEVSTEPATPSGSGTVSGVGSVTGAGFTARSGSGSVVGVGLLPGDGFTNRSGFGSVDAVGSVSGEGSIETAGSGQVSGVASLAADSSVSRSGASLVAGVGSLAGDGSALEGAGGAGQVVGVGSVTGDGLVSTAGSGSIEGVGLAEGDGLHTAQGAGDILGLGSITGDGLVVASGSGDVSGIGSLVGDGLTPTFFDPANLVATPDGDTVHLTWDEAITPGVVDYLVFRRTPQTGEPFDPQVDTPIATGIALLEYDDTELTSGDYDWQVFGRIPGSEPSDDFYSDTYTDTY